MPDSTGRGSGEGEDLFEDLDKFFAPIQDVDWPDTAAPAAPSPASVPSDAAAPTGAPGRGSAPEPARAEDTAAFEPIVGEEPAEQVAGQDELFDGAAAASSGDDDAPSSAGTTGASDAATADAADDDAEAGGGTGFLFGEDDLADDDAITEEAFAQSPNAYADLPGPSDDEPGVAELEETPTPAEATPDLETVEAAADHFAESVRDEVHIDPQPVTTSTEEVEISSLLGDDDDGEPEAAPEPTRTVRVGPEGLGGPSWQEPTAVEVGAEPERRGSGRDVPMAFLTGIVLAALALGALAVGAGAFAVLAGIVVLFAQGEFYFALQKRHYQPATALGLVAGALVLAGGYYRGEPAILAMVVLGTFASFLWYMTVPVQHRRNVVSNIALTVLGIVYIPATAAYLFALLRATDGRSYVIAIIGLTIVYDIGAFAVGSMWGMRPFAPNVSPKKSWEGAIGATLVVIAVSVGVVANFVDPLGTLGRSVGLALVVAIFAPLGDLAESLLKRDLGLKDMGSVLPGHGGVLDRIDAVLFVAPAAFLFLRLILF